MNEIYPWIIILLGGGVIFTGGGILVFFGRKLKSLDDIEDNIHELRESVVLRMYCKERHGVINNRIKTGEEKFTKLTQFVVTSVGEIKEMVARIDERTARMTRE
jgi:hypothetical protein